MSTISTPRVSDNYLITLFVDKYLKNNADYSLSTQSKVTITISATNLSVSLNDDNEIVSTHEFMLEKLRSTPSQAISRITIQDPSTQHCTFTYSRHASSLIDVVDFNASAKIESVILFQQQIQADLLLNSDTLKPSYSAEAANNSLSENHQILTQLAGLNANLILEQHKHHNEVEEHKINFMEINEQKHLSKQSFLEETYSNNQAELEKNYQEKNELLEIREQAVSDADNTTSRRNTTTSILNKVQAKAERFTFSSSVNFRSQFTVFLCLILISTAIWNGLSALTALDELNYITVVSDSFTKATLRPTAEKPIEMLWFLYLRVLFSSVLFISSTLYLIKWINSWADRIAQQELNNQKFVRDLIWSTKLGLCIFNLSINYFSLLSLIKRRCCFTWLSN